MITPARAVSDEATPITVSFDGKTLQVMCKAQPLSRIVYALLQTSGMRFQSEGSHGKGLYDVDVTYATARAGAAARRDVLDVLCKVSGTVVEEVSAERDVWVARREGDGNQRLERSHGAVDGIGHVKYADGTSGVFNASSGELFSYLESYFQVLIDDDTHLEGEYDFGIGPYRGDLEDVRQALESKYGIVLSKDRRKVKIYHLRAARPEDVPAHNVVQGSAKKG